MKKRFYTRLVVSLVFCLSHLISSAQFKVVGYMPTWVNFNSQVEAIDWSKYTHVNISFGNPKASGAIDEGLSITQLQTLVTKVHASEGKILISIGGANAPDYTNYLTSENRADFVQQWVDYVEFYKLDGVDVDLEGGDVPEFYTEFVQDLSAALKPKGKLVTAALGTWFSNRISDEALAEFDWVNIMAYDETGSWNPNNPGQHSSMEKAEKDLQFWKNRGLTKDKVVLGVPFYGYDFDNNGVGKTYRDIVAANDGAENFDQVGELYYNGQPTIRKKTELAIEEAAGVMIWEITQDVDTNDSRSLLTAIYNTINNNISEPVVEITSPEENQIFPLNDVISLKATAEDTLTPVSNVSFYANGTLIFKDNAAPYVYNWTPTAAKNYTLSAVATNEDGYSSVAELAISVRAPQGPYKSTLTIPGVIQAENYDVGGQDSSYSDIDIINQGGQYRTDAVDIENTNDGGPGSINVGWIETGEWLEYSVSVDSTTTYRLDTRIASESGGGEFHIELNSTDVTGSITVSSTGGWQDWTTLRTEDIELTAGDYILRFAVDKGGFNLNHFAFYLANVDCNGDLDGEASLDVCGICSGGETGITPSTSDLDCVIGLINKQEYTFEVYPNPSSNNIHIESEQAISEWVLSDPLGTTILKGNSVDINIESLVDGIYILMVDGKSKKIEKY